MSTSRDATPVLKTGIVRKLLSGFNVSNVSGINKRPLIIQARPQHFTERPYIYVGDTSNNESYTTKSSSSRTYDVEITVVAESAINKSAEGIRDGIVAEVIRILDVNTAGYVDLLEEGYSVFIQNATTGDTDVDETLAGATYFTAAVNVEFTIDYVGLPQSNQPTFTPEYTFTLDLNTTQLPLTLNYMMRVQLLD